MGSISWQGKLIYKMQRYQGAKRKSINITKVNNQKFGYTSHKKGKKVFFPLNLSREATCNVFVN